MDEGGGGQPVAGALAGQVIMCQLPHLIVDDGHQLVQASDTPCERATSLSVAPWRSGMGMGERRDHAAFFTKQTAWDCARSSLSRRQPSHYDAPVSRAPVWLRRRVRRREPLGGRLSPIWAET